jgi:hypothetical protein
VCVRVCVCARACIMYNMHSVCVCASEDTALYEKETYHPLKGDTVHIQKRPSI